MDILRSVIISAGLADIVLGVYPILLRKRSKVVLGFTLVTFVIALWTITNALVTLKPIEFWIKNSYAVGILVPPVVLLWLLLLLGKKIHKKIVASIAIPGIVLIIFTYSTDLVIKYVSSTTIGGFVGEFGSLYFIYSLYFFGTIASIFYLVIGGYRTSRGIQRDQLRFVTLGLIGFGVSVLLVSFIFPLLGEDRVIPLDSPSSIFFIASISYAMVRHRLLDIRIVVTRSIIYGLLLTVVTLLFVFITFLSAQFFGNTTTSRNFIAFLVATLIVFGLDPLKGWLSRATDKTFFKAKIDYQEVLRSLSEKISVEVELDALLQSTSDELARELKLKHADILIADKKGNLCRRDGGTGPLVVGLLKDDETVRYLKEKGKAVEKAGLERKIEDTLESEQKNHLEQAMKRIEALDAEVIAPITSQNQLNAALVLGPKQSGDTFNAEELRLFAVLGPQIGSAIEKAKLYSEVKSFTRELEEKVDEATSELKERNRFLLSLQEMTSIITHSLDYKKVTQQVVDGIAKQLGYIGGILILRDKNTGETWAEAITNTAVTRAAIKLLPRPVASYRGNIRDASLTNEAMSTGEIRQGSRMAEFLHPALPDMLSNAVQKLARIKHLVAVPISSEQDVVGAIIFGVGKEGEQISEQELAMMKSLADQAGIVLRNLRLFEAIQRANAELERANEHLRTLDEAKSEFISIASHQLRTPMTGIMGYLSMLVDGDFGSLDPKFTKILTELLEQSQRMIRLINIFLNISKIEAGRFELEKKPAHIEEVIDMQFIELAKLAKDKKLKLVFKRPKPELPEALVDRDKLADVIQNLVDNAIKYTEKGSVTVSGSTVDGMIRVDVKDTGRGLKKSEAEKLFNKFVRGDGIARIHPDGSGLGLYIAKKIIESHGGKIWVESEGEGKGSTFSFAVPVQ